MFVRSSALPTVLWVVWGYGWGTQNCTNIAVRSLKIPSPPAWFEARLLKNSQGNIFFFFPTACAHIVLALWCTGIDHWPSSRNWYANKIRIKLKVCWPEGSRHAKFMILMDFFYNVKHTKLCINRTQWPHATAPTSQLSYLIVPVSVVLWCSKSLRVQRSGPYACDTAIFQPKAVRPHLCLVVVAIFKKIWLDSRRSINPKKWRTCHKKNRDSTNRTKKHVMASFSQPSTKKVVDKMHRSFSRFQRKKNRETKISGTPHIARNTYLNVLKAHRGKKVWGRQKRPSNVEEECNKHTNSRRAIYKKSRAKIPTTQLGARTYVL